MATQPPATPPLGAIQSTDTNAGGTAHATCATGSFDADCIVIGTGPAGLTTALALAEVGAIVIVTGPAVTPDQARSDTRTTAIFAGGITLLQRLKVWDGCRDAAEALQAIRIVDDTGRLLRAPETLFRASELGPEPFGYNIPNAALVAALNRAISASPRVTFVETSEVTDIAINETKGAAVLALAPGRRLASRLVAGADGRRSLARKAAGISPYSWDYDQGAVVCSFAHTRAHENISTEFHRPNGPFTTVPLPGNKSSLVWVETRAEAQRLKDLGDEAIAAAIEDRLGGLLGTVTGVGPRAYFPLSGMAARALAANRIALIGEAAHVVPPIGAQGLNLGLRDGAALADAVGDALKTGSDPGSETVLSNYRKARRNDVLSRTLAVDLLNRTLLSNMLPAQALRGAGLHALNAFATLRHLVMREGMQPLSTLPRLMQSSD